MGLVPRILLGRTPWGTVDVLLFLLLPGAVSSKQNVFFVVIEVFEVELSA